MFSCGVVSSVGSLARTASLVVGTQGGHAASLPSASADAGSAASVARCARDAASGGMRHCALPFQQIVHELLPRRPHDPSRNAVFQVMVFWGAEADERNAGGTSGSSSCSELELRWTLRMERGLPHCLPLWRRLKTAAIQRR